MTQDIPFRDREKASLIYLFLGNYHDERGVARSVRWCGPRARVGSGFTYTVPGGTPASDGGGSSVWETRMSRCSFDLTLGNLTQHMQAISDLTFNVDINMGSQTPTDLEPGDLRRDVVFGRWKNNNCSLWIVDKDTEESTLVASGVFDRNPTSIAPNNFAVTVAVTPLFPSNELWPCGQVPYNTDDYTYDMVAAPNGFTWFLPTQYMLSPDHYGKFLGPAFGDPTAAGERYIYREAIPFGRRTASAPNSLWVFAWVSPQTNCYVEDVWIEVTINDNIPVTISAGYFKTLENTDPTKGPIGTWVRFLYTAGFVWWGPQIIADPSNPHISSDGAKSRCFVRISGYGSGQKDYDELDANGLNPVTIYKRSSSTIRGRVWDVIQDSIEDPQLLGRPGEILGSNAISKFQSTAPLGSPLLGSAIHYANLVCAVPPELETEPPSFREVFQGLAASFPFDFVMKNDGASSGWRMFPIWRPGFNTSPDHVFGVADMSKTDPPAIQQFDNADGHYANQVLVETPVFFGVPLVANSSTTSGGENNISPDETEVFMYSSTSEQGPKKENGIVPGETTWSFWLHAGLQGNSDASKMLGLERAQPQRTVQATHGFRSFGVELGDSIQYDIPGVNGDVGMVRKMRFDYDLQQVQITSYHVDHPSATIRQQGEDRSHHHEQEDDE